MALPQDPTHIRFGHLATADADFDRDNARCRETAGEIDHNLDNGFTRHLLGGVDSFEQRGRDRVKIDDLALADPA